MDFAIPVVKIKENEKSDKYLDLIKKLKKLRNMRLTVIPIVIGAHRLVPRGLEKELKELEIRS